MSRAHQPAAPIELPAGDLLPHAAAVRCHAGHNTVCEALARGVPLVLAPIEDDRPIVAQQVEWAGASGAAAGGGDGGTGGSGRRRRGWRRMCHPCLGTAPLQEARPDLTPPPLQKPTS